MRRVSLSSGRPDVPLMLGDWQSYNYIYGTTQQSRRLVGRIVCGDLCSTKNRHLE
jgi:hypothetical protein